tara:strand:+ start:196 stop:411 length:216 start_codon:yes stop_codon:yes gene_type:complete
MKVLFNDLFKVNDSTVTAKKNIRIGALVIPEGHSIDPKNPELGLPLDEWKDKSFDVSVDQDTFSINQVIDS